MVRRPRETPRTPPHLADQAPCAAEEADTAGRDRIYVAYLNYSECKTGPIYRAETLQVGHGGQQSERQSPGQRVPSLPPSPSLPEASLRPRWRSPGVGVGGSGVRSHDARRGEDRAHAQGVCDLPATGQRLAHALGVLVLFFRQQLPSKCFPAGREGHWRQPARGPQARGSRRPLHRKTQPPGCRVPTWAPASSLGQEWGRAAEVSPAALFSPVVHLHSRGKGTHIY